MRWILLLPLSITMTLLALLLAPVLALLARERSTAMDDGSVAIGYWLPRWLWWFQTPDNSLLGDGGHAERWDHRISYARMVAWLWRNPAYGVEWDGPLAARINHTGAHVLFGNPWIKNRQDAVAGWYYCRVADYWNFKVIAPLWGDLAFMGELGWKLQPWAQERPDGDRAMYVCSIRLTAFYPKG